MPNARALNERRFAPALAGELLGMVADFVDLPMRFVTAFQRQAQVWIFLEATALLFPIAFYDFSTGYEVSLSILYCVPIFL
ncbi:MAG TPA: hypothetical protein VK581_03320, partial [Chthoniobacterales bacterium]|nr:hypothetical protein [Chthoniobacterales bacterium]